LNEVLRKFDLKLNHDKTLVRKLPDGLFDGWVAQLRMHQFPQHKYSGEKYKGKDWVNYKDTQHFLGLAVRLAEENGNTSVIFYAMKILAKQNLTDSAKRLFANTAMTLATIYPYLIRYLEKFVFSRMNADSGLISDFAKGIYSSGKEARHFESMVFAIYFALQFDFRLSQVDEAQSSDIFDDCLLRLMLAVYYEQNGFSEKMKEMRSLAGRLKSNSSDFERNWLFVYEVLPEEKLDDSWKVMKQNGVSFLKENFRIS
ncbi:MAG: hypothetical protein LBJ07_00335, partial [Actinomycetes bacterium]|nr:hypothetical protein [Actinomycetes bacterium]